MAVDGDLKKRGPYIFDIPYTVAGLTHHMTWQCSVDGVVEPGELPINITLRTRNGVGRTLADAAATFWDKAKVFIPTTSVTAQYYLYRAQAGTDKLFYVSSGELESAAAGGAVAPSRQATLTFRTALSSVARLVFLEGAGSASDDIGPLSADSGSANPAFAMAGWVVAPLSPMLGIDGSWIVAPLTAAYTQNEAVYEKRNRA